MAAIRTSRVIFSKAARQRFRLYSEVELGENVLALANYRFNGRRSYSTSDSFNNLQKRRIHVQSRLLFSYPFFTILSFYFLI